MKVCDTLAKFNMITPSDRVLCALSGGADSVVLTHYLASNAKALGITVAAAHFSHGIRREAAEEEKQLCEELCKQLDIEFFSGEGDSVEYARKNKMGLEEAARELRYRFLESVSDRWGADRIATAHHADDNAETVIMNARRGASLTGLSGIPAVRGRYIRPLIQTSRSEIEEYAARHSLPFATDATNLEPCCLRNEIRLCLLPEMRSIYPDTNRLLNRFSDLARVYNDSINCKAKELNTHIEYSENEAVCDVNLLACAEKAVAARMYEIICRNMGGGMLSSRHIMALHGLCLSTNPSAQTDLPGLCAKRRYDRIVFSKPECKAKLSDTIIRIGERVSFGSWEAEAKEGRHQDGVLLDKTKISFPLTLRSRREGDRIFINGCTKSVKKLMIERKIPKEIRDTIPVLSDNNKVLAIAGIGYDKSMKTDTDKNTVSIIFRRIK